MEDYVRNSPASLSPALPRVIRGPSTSAAELYPGILFEAVLKLASMLWWMKVGAITAYEGLSNWQPEQRDSPAAKARQLSGSTARTWCCIGSLTMGSLDMALAQSMPREQFRDRILITGAACLAMYGVLHAAGMLQRALLRGRLGREPREGSLQMAVPPAGQQGALQPP
uniref:Uncharacterized protein n=1 Tax=Tetraselmis sp. GSL018 TaxID=582737 RepID=A0A061QQ14_9CHLO